ncbi:MAG: site-2 protease family protein [Oligoflexales bacterium]
MDFSDIAQVMNNMIALIFALSFHEAAHAFAAHVQGDKTAKMDGRLTLNPIPHIDPIGTIVFPLLGAIAGGAVIGWAKPVPVDVRNLRNQKWGYVLVAAAGPLSNLLLCFISIFLLRGYENYGTHTISPEHFLYPLVELLTPLIFINAILAIFNLLPLFPLDGGTVFTAFLPYNLKGMYDQYIAPYGMFILLALFFTNSLSWMGRIALGYIHFADAVVQRIFT